MLAGAEVEGSTRSATSRSTRRRPRQRPALSTAGLHEARNELSSALKRQAYEQREEGTRDYRRPQAGLHLQGDQEACDPGPDQGRRNDGRRTEAGDRRGERSVQGGALYASHRWMPAGAGVSPGTAGEVTDPVRRTPASRAASGRVAVDAVVGLISVL